MLHLEFWSYRAVSSLPRRGMVFYTTHQQKNSSNQPEFAGVSSQNAALMRSYKILQVAATNSDVEIKQAFIDLAKKYHPDSSQTPDNEKFKSVEEAYRIVMRSRKSSDVSSEEAEESIEKDIRRTTAAHRHYLSNEGIGYGTPSQRQRQYQQFRLDRAQERAFGYQLGKMTALSEDALLTLDKQATKKFKTQNAVERVVEDLIQESMARGEFSNLSGMGKPLNDSDHNPYVDSMTNKINKILIQNGFVPEWAQLGKQIETMKEEVKELLISERAKYGEELTETEQNRWEEFLKNNEYLLEDINAKIQRFNFQVPTIQQQLAPVRMHILARKVLEGNEWRNRVRQRAASLEAAAQAREEKDASEKEFDEFWSLVKQTFQRIFLRHFRL